MTSQSQKWFGLFNGISDTINNTMSSWMSGPQEWLERYGRAEGFGSLGAGYERTAAEDALKAIQAVELANFKLEQASAAATTAQRALDSATSTYNSILSNIEGLVRQLKTVGDAFKNAADDLLRARKNLWESDANLSMESRLSVAQSDFDRVFGLAMSGDADAAKELAGMGDTLLSLYRETATSSQAYNDAFYAVDQQMRLAQEAQELQYKTEKSQYDALMKQYGLQETQSMTQDDILRKINEQKAELATANNAMLEAQNIANTTMSEQSKVLQKSIEAAQFAAEAAMTAANTGSLQAPTITAPAANAIVLPTGFTVTGSAFAPVSGSTDTMKALYVQVATDALFTKKIYDSGRVLTTSTTHAVTFPAQPQGTALFSRMRYEGTTLGISGYSEPVRTVVTAVQIPTITSPANGATGVPARPLVTLSAYSDTGNLDSGVNTQVQIATDKAFTNIVYDSGELAYTTSHTVVTALAPDVQHFIRGRHKGNLLGWTGLSSDVSITTGYVQTPTITSPAENSFITSTTHPTVRCCLPGRG